MSIDHGTRLTRSKIHPIYLPLITPYACLPARTYIQKAADDAQNWSQTILLQARRCQQAVNHPQPPKLTK